MRLHLTNTETTTGRIRKHDRFEGVELLRVEIEVPAVRGIAEDVAHRLGLVLPRAVTRISDRTELHPVFLERHGVVTADPVELNVGYRRLAILAERIISMRTQSLKQN